MLRAVIFDFDGVITDSEILHLRAFNRVLAQYGIEITTKDYYKEYLGLTDVDCFQLLIHQGLLEAEQQQIARLRPFFAVIVSAEQVRKGKPHPEGFLLTLQELNSNVTDLILPNQCIAIEDSHWGLKAAKAAGMHTVAVTNSYDAEQLTMAERIVARLNELSIGDLQKLCA